jgi:hypothetical protein
MWRKPAKYPEKSAVIMNTRRDEARWEGTRRFDGAALK